MMTEEEMCAHETARDAIKHFTTLSTAVIGFLLIVFKPEEGPPSLSLRASYVCLVSSILFGALGLCLLAGNLEKRPAASIYHSNTTFVVGLQVVLFVAGLYSAGTAYKLTWT